MPYELVASVARLAQHVMFTTVSWQDQCKLASVNASHSVHWLRYSAIPLKEVQEERIEASLPIPNM